MKDIASSAAATSEIGEAFKALRALGSSVQTLTDGSEQHDCQRVADTGCNAVYQRADERIAVGNVGLSSTEHRTVGGDQRQEDTERRVQRRHSLLHEHLDELNQRCNYENERDGLHVAQTQGFENEVLYSPGCCGSDRHNEDNRHAHAERGVGLLGYAEERAAAEELNENVVVDQDCRDCERQDIGQTHRGR